MTARNLHRRADRRGGALILVLWVLALLSLLAGTALELAVSSARIARSLQTRTQLDAVADGVVNRTLLALADPDPKNPLSIDGSPTTTEAGADRVTVTIIDEGGKLDVNAVPREWLTALFVARGARPGDAEEWVKRIGPAGNRGNDIDAGVAASAARYPRVFRRLEEVAYVGGIPPSAFDCARPYLTVYTGFPSVDLRHATAVVRQLIALVNGTAPGAPASAAAGINDAYGSYAGRVFKITATATDSQSASSASRTAVARITGDAEQPFLIEDWRKDDGDAPATCTAVTAEVGAFGQTLPLE